MTLGPQFWQTLICVGVGYVLGGVAVFASMWKANKDTMALLERLGMLENPDDPRTSD